jgi:glycosyltransferase involved in cell wall biosynthesis
VPPPDETRFAEGLKAKRLASTPDAAAIRTRGSRFVRRPLEEKLDESEVLLYPGASDLGSPRRVKLSILMPAYNEERTIERAVHAVLSAEYPCDIEVIIIDDGSSDATRDILRRVKDPRARIFCHPRNIGKGAALSTGAAVASGTHIVPFDTDLEYSPTDLPRLLAPVIEGRCDVVYGTRLFGANTMYQSYRHAAGNRALTLAANLIYDAALTDLHTCMKLMPLALFRQLELREDRFGLDTEVTARMLKMGIRPFEVPISYHSRSFLHGKKITWKDGVQCVSVLLRVRLARGGNEARMGDVSPIADDGSRAQITRELELERNAS